MRISELKRGDVFKFNSEFYTVKQKFSNWKKGDEPYLVTGCGTLFYDEELEVIKCSVLSVKAARKLIGKELNIFHYGYNQESEKITIGALNESRYAKIILVDSEGKETDFISNYGQEFRDGFTDQIAYYYL